MSVVQHFLAYFLGSGSKRNDNKGESEEEVIEMKNLMD